MITKEFEKKYKGLFGSWYEIIKPFLVSDDFKKISKHLKERTEEGYTVYPVFDDVFRAFRECPFDKLKVVILTNNSLIEGNDGLALSCRSCNTKLLSTWPKLTQSVMSAFEDNSNGLYLEQKPDLSYLAKQGVLLLNCDLTTEKKAGSHLKLWEPFVKYILTVSAELSTFVIFLLVGKEAHKYESIVKDKEKNDVYSIEHPMLAIKEKRNWKHHKIFFTISNITKLIHNEEIKWT